jgi:hypothetical protein
MRKLLYAVLGLVVLLLIAVGLAAVFVDADAIGAFVAEQASLALGEPVEFGEVDLALFPPAAELRAVRIGKGEKPLADIDEIKVRVSIPALLIGQVVLRSVELNGPRINLELDDDGAPVLPQGASGGASPSDASTEDAPRIAITSLRVRDGSLSAGPWEVRELRADGGLNLNGTASVELAAHVVGLARIESAEIELSELLGDTPVWNVVAELTELDLAVLSERLELEDMELSGAARASVTASGRAENVESAKLELRTKDLVYESGDLRLAGDVPVDATLGGPFRVDLKDAELISGELIHKPRGAALAVYGQLGPEPGPEALGAVTIDVGGSSFPAIIDASGSVVRTTLGPGELDLAPLRDWWVGEVVPTSGRVTFDPFGVTAEPLESSGSLTLHDVQVPLVSGTVTLSGPVRGDGPRLLAGPLKVTLAEQQATLNAVYELESGRFEVDGDIPQAQLDPLVRAVTGESSISGALVGSLKLAGDPDPATIRGPVSFEITDGRIQGFSIVKSVVGELAAVPLLVAQLKGKDLSRYEEEEFRRMAGTFNLGGGLARTDDLVLEYRHATAYLNGTVGLLDGALRMQGKIVISKALDEEVTGASGGGEERVIPITSIGGTVDSPRVILDRQAVSSVLSTYATSPAVKKELEERLGPGGAEAVESILDNLFRGGKKR